MALLLSMSHPALMFKLYVSHVVMEFLPCTKVVALGRGISGKLMATGGILTRDSRESEDSEELMLSTCKICEVHLHYDII